MNEKLMIELAKEYGLKVESVEQGKGGFFYYENGVEKQGNFMLENMADYLKDDNIINANIQELNENIMIFSDNVNITLNSSDKKYNKVIDFTASVRINKGQYNVWKQLSKVAYMR